MEPESSLPYSQAPATCPYPQPTYYYVLLLLLLLLLLTNFMKRSPPWEAG